MKALFAVLSALFLVAFVNANTKVILIKDILSEHDVGARASNNKMGELEAIAENVATETLKIPMRLKICSDGLCDFTCKILGYNHGTCYDSNTCRCYN